jgi:hypothetical protein
MLVSTLHADIVTGYDFCRLESNQNMITQQGIYFCSQLSIRFICLPLKL